MIEARLKKIVCQTFKIGPEQFNEDLAAGDIPAWDSLGHVTLLQAVEEEFNIALDVSDAIDIETIGDLIGIVSKYVHQDPPTI